MGTGADVREHTLVAENRNGGLGVQENPVRVDVGIFRLRLHVGELSECCAGCGTRWMPWALVSVVAERVTAETGDALMKNTISSCHGPLLREGSGAGRGSGSRGGRRSRHGGNSLPGIRWARVRFEEAVC